MQVTFKTLHYAEGTYLGIKDSDGADVSFLIESGETARECLERYISEQQRKARVAKANSERMIKWLSQYCETET